MNNYTKESKKLAETAELLEEDYKYAFNGFIGGEYKLYLKGKEVWVDDEHTNQQSYTGNSSVWCWIKDIEKALAEYAPHYFTNGPYPNMEEETYEYLVTKFKNNGGKGNE